MGYLPEAMRNYLVRLGWSHGDEEIFSTDEMIEAFNLASIGRSPSRFDFAKLENLNGHYMRQASDEELVITIDALLPTTRRQRGALGDAFARRCAPKLLAAMPGLKERAKTLVELARTAPTISPRTRPLKLDDKAPRLIARGRARLASSIVRGNSRPSPLDPGAHRKPGARVTQSKLGSNSARWRSRCGPR